MLAKDIETHTLMIWRRWRRAVSSYVSPGEVIPGSQNQLVLEAFDQSHHWLHHQTLALKSKMLSESNLSIVA